MRPTVNNNWLVAEDQFTQPTKDNTNRIVYHSLSHGKTTYCLEYNSADQTVKFTSYHNITGEKINSWRHCGHVFYGGKPFWFVNFALRIDNEMEGEWIIVPYPPGKVLDVYTLCGRKVKTIPCPMLDRNSNNFVFYDKENPGKVRLTIGSKCSVTFLVDLYSCEILKMN